MIYTEDEQQLEDIIDRVLKGYNNLSGKIAELYGPSFYDAVKDSLIQEIMKSWRRC